VADAVAGDFANGGPGTDECTADADDETVDCEP
jgi:hypothetical protein